LITDALKLITKPRCLARYSLTLAAATLAAFALVACGGEMQSFSDRVDDFTNQAEALSDEIKELEDLPADTETQLQELAAQLRGLNTRLTDAARVVPTDQVCLPQPDHTPVYATSDAPFAFTELNGFTDTDPNQDHANLVLNSFRTNLEASVIYCAEFETEDGVFVAELYPQCSPIAVGMFVYLAQTGFYDGLTFHDVRDNFFAAGGDPLANGTGNPGFLIEGQDESCPEYRHNRAGTISLINAGRPNTTGSLFLITMGTGEFTNAWDTYDASGVRRDCNSVGADGARITCYPVIGRVIHGFEENVLSIDPRDQDTATTPGERIVSIRITQQDMNTRTVTPFTTVIPQVATVESIYANLDRDISYRALIDTSRGVIIADLYPQCSPIAVANFMYLANNGFYDNIQFHRVLDNFVVQGGDPLAVQGANLNDQEIGSGGPPYRFGELSCSDYTHNTQGVISMANTGNFNTNGSQFFIAKADSSNDISHLDMYDANGELRNCAATSCHPIFGAVTSGMDVVNSIVQGDILLNISVVPEA